MLFHRFHVKFGGSWSLGLSDLPGAGWRSAAPPSSGSQVGPPPVAMGMPRPQVPVTPNLLFHLSSGNLRIELPASQKRGVTGVSLAGRRQL